MFGDAHNELAIALANNGEYDKAINHFQIAEKLSTRPEIRELAGLNLLKIELQGKDNIQKG
jgi:Flp pilus assembly protein TadD